MKSESTHYTPPTDGKPDLLQSITNLQRIIDENTIVRDIAKDNIFKAKKTLGKLNKIKADYEKAISGVSDTIIHDEATDLNGVIRGDDESPESYMKRLELAGKTERE